MPTRYDDRDFERYDDRAREDYRRRERADYERERDTRGGAYGYDERRGADRFTGGRYYDEAESRRTDYPRGARRFDYEREGTYESDYRAPNDRDYDRGDFYGRTYGRAGERTRRGGRDYYDTRAARDYDTDANRRDYDYNRRERDYAPRGYDYDERRDDWTLRRGARTPERTREDSETRPRDFRPRKERGWWERVSDEVASWFGDEQAERRRLSDEARGGALHHRGRGPRGYHRSDERIREDINDRLTDHPYIDATGIEVEVHTGEVTLNGTVESRQAKRLAEDIAESIAGVTNVENRLRIQHGAFETIEPEELPTPATAMTAVDATGATTAAAGTDVTPTATTSETTKVRATSAGEGGTKK